MANVSLARIMYGTSEEFHASAETSVSATRSMRSLTESNDTSADDRETLGELLHRVWTNLSGKH